VEVIPVNMRDAGEIERAVAAFARSSNGGLIVTAGAAAIVGRQLIPALAAKHKLPAVYPARDFVTSGGLISSTVLNLLLLPVLAIRFGKFVREEPEQLEA
jgi:putative ABC transport system substrate-binding protein